MCLCLWVCILLCSCPRRSEASTQCGCWELNLSSKRTTNAFNRQVISTVPEIALLLMGQSDDWTSLLYDWLVNLFRMTRFKVWILQFTFSYFSSHPGKFRSSSEECSSVCEHSLIYHYNLGLLSKAQIDGMDALEGGREGGKEEGEGRNWGRVPKHSALILQNWALGKLLIYSSYPETSSFLE